MSESGRFIVQQDAFTGTLTELAVALRSGAVAPQQLDVLRLVTDYLVSYRELAAADLTLASETLPQVAHVIELKVRLLLPRPPRSDDDEDLVDEVLEAVHLLEELEEAIGFLRERRSQRRLMLAAHTPKPAFARPERPLRVPLVKLAELAARRRLPGYFEVAVERFTLAQAMSRLAARLRRLKRGRLSELIEASDWPTRTVVFAGMLELIRAGEVRASQERPYGDIDLELAAAAPPVEDAA